MKRLVIDIETVGTPWEEHDTYVREYLIKGLSEAEAEEEKRRGALSPFTGRIVTIGIVNADTHRSCAFMEIPDQEELRTERDGDRTFISGSEKAILEKFWSSRRRRPSRDVQRAPVRWPVPDDSFRDPRRSPQTGPDRFPVSSTRTAISATPSTSRDGQLASVPVRSRSRVQVVRNRQLEERRDGRTNGRDDVSGGPLSRIAEYCLEDVRATCEA